MSAYKVISAEEFGRRFNDGQIHVIDVRNPPEFAGGHVEGALLCPLGELNPPKILADLQASGFGSDDRQVCERVKPLNFWPRRLMLRSLL